ncbi:mitogen-activated protein kinase kinase kinase kinase [Capsaspora owczarzaki ATCC 30864]|uniref:STE/STE20 protein kinase n=1 Tax=Capsaspora owczarzaki (strain ATCC 30864) TaxID=595528 RepID=A0A0D2USN2_CAPO3|nr:mitogen-activated protein kinase kinase kinase kinase [Capsaspora owczarzaki ATCC 30864]KJE97971.1 STE/STE20 protein kinase [Capsaspora owczarzaki ATCC 30864]|eukprot:XP_004342636.2 mitogen-activated protein kinase kinase kinase kinase [Capsaspora owczarzaki ATCC 30864]
MSSASTPARQLFDLHGQFGETDWGPLFKATSRTTSDVLTAEVISFDGIEEDEATLRAQSVRALYSRLADANGLVDHPNIERFMGIFRDKRELWITTEYCSAGQLQNIVQIAKGLPEEAIAYVSAEVLKGVRFLHAAGVVHRNITLDSVLLGLDASVKLAKFDVSRELQHSSQRLKSFVGLPHYLSPEMLITNSYGPKIDIWAIGITAIAQAEMFPPRHELHPLKVMMEIPRAAPPTLKDAKRWSSNFNDFVAACLVREEDARPTSTDLAKHPFLTSKASASRIILRGLLEQYATELAEMMHDDGSAPQAPTSSTSAATEDHDLSDTVSYASDSLVQRNPVHFDTDSDSDPESHPDMLEAIDESDDHVAPEAKARRKRAKSTVKKNPFGLTAQAALAQAAKLPFTSLKYLSLDDLAIAHRLDDDDAHYSSTRASLRSFSGICTGVDEDSDAHVQAVVSDLLPPRSRRRSIDPTELPEHVHHLAHLAWLHQHRVFTTVCPHEAQTALEATSFAVHQVTGMYLKLSHPSAMAMP